MSLFVDSRFPRIGNTFVEDGTQYPSLLKSNSFSHLSATLGDLESKKQSTMFKMQDLPCEKYRSLSLASTCVALSSDSESQSPSVEPCLEASQWDFDHDDLECATLVEHIVALPDDDPNKTTVVAKNFPSEYTKSMVLELLEESGFRGKYDFVYLPVDFTSQRSFGYAFINFVTHANALHFGELFNGFSYWAVRSDHVGIAEWSGAMQGLAEHVERYRDSPMMHRSLPDAVKPVIFKDGERCAFPPPTKALKMPRRATRNRHSCEPAVSERTRASNTSFSSCGVRHTPGR
jgi:hypothetical protein